MSTESTNYQANPCPHYVGRFAPSPTGPLHFGSLVAAVASYCDAKKNNGKWLVRMEDLDKPREVVGAANDILCTLEAFGFEWDGEVIFQSQSAEFYEYALQTLHKRQLIYACTCSRKEIADSSTSTGIDGAIYPKTCYPKTCFNKEANSSTSEKHAAASLIDTASWRINVEDADLITFKDAIQGEISQHLSHHVGDFIIKRKNGIFAYQLAVVADDALQNITHIVRGADLLDSTPRQIYLQQLLGFAKPSYAHVPVAANAAGEKLSKQTLAQPICIKSETSSHLAENQLFDALNFLGQNPPPEIKNATLAETWRWAIANWQLSKVPKTKLIKVS